MADEALTIKTKFDKAKVFGFHTGHESTPRFIFLLGFSMFAAVTALYAVNLSRSEGLTHSLWIVVLTAHLACFVFVLFDAFPGMCRNKPSASGELWPLQLLVIGCGSFATLLLPALVARTAQEDGDVALAVGALGAACAANAMMLAMVFEYFHRGTRKAMELAEKATPAPSIGAEAAPVAATLADAESVPLTGLTFSWATPAAR